MRWETLQLRGYKYPQGYEYQKIMRISRLPTELSEK